MLVCLVAQVSRLCGSSIPGRVRVPYHGERYGFCPHHTYPKAPTPPSCAVSRLAHPSHQTLALAQLLTGSPNRFCPSSPEPVSVCPVSPPRGLAQNYPGWDEGWLTVVRRRIQIEDEVVEDIAELGLDGVEAESQVTKDISCFVKERDRHARDRSGINVFRVFS